MDAVHLRPDLQRLLDELGAVDRAVEHLVSTLSDAQFFWQPDGGRSWSIAQCLEHLAITNTLYGEAIAQGIEHARARGLTGGGPISLSFFARMFVGSMEPPVTRRFRAPGRITPRTSRTREEILQLFSEGHARLRESVRAAADVDVNRATFTNPLVRLFRPRVGTGLQLIPAHDRRHLWQAENVRKTPGFPTAG